MSEHVGIVERNNLEYIIFDIDGTLADGSSRAHLIPQGDARATTQGWEEFNKACAGDNIVTPVYAIYSSLQENIQAGMLPNKEIILLTSRTDTCEEETCEWLMKYRIMAPLYMREEDDHSSPVEFKEKFIDELYNNGHSVWMAFDDHKGVIEMMRNKGINAMHVTEWWEYGFKTSEMKEEGGE